MRIVILTGAGISAESGIPTFRTDDGGPALWAQHRIEDVATPEAYRRDPDLVHAFYRARREAAARAEPNAAHIALAEAAEVLGERMLVVTQNVDDLHERAGHPASGLVHMHGRLASAFCTACGVRIEGGGFGDACACGRGVLRPDIVWFGEMPYEMDRIERAILAADLFVAIGTSGEVYPAAGFVDLANEVGAQTVELNLAPTSGVFRASVTGPASETVPALVRDLLDAHR